MSEAAISAIRAFSDNYIWCIRRDRQAAVVDPGDAGPVLTYLRAHGLELTAILCTHHHGDHVGGNARLLAQYNVPVYGPADEPIPGVTRRLREGDEIVVPGVELRLRVLDIPGHTRGHIGYAGAGLLFCGDTLFSCGCGRLFEGTPAQMYASLSKLAVLPEQTRVYCAHEYTLSNLRFARAVEPDNPALAEREATARAALERGEPSLPSTIAMEKAANPFLRTGLAALRESASRRAGRKLDDPVEVFAVLRQWKDSF
ncbi:MAG TPA: hydroxyacylglutathione hydrolase [Burkholderiales bacterium]|jgi:hydroxyacylglutathione hydrolase|nr:hydroxyacylglutathione hydrolase [Burkholderiales bacterium]